MRLFLCFFQATATLLAATLGHAEPQFKSLGISDLPFSVLPTPASSTRERATDATTPSNQFPIGTIGAAPPFVKLRHFQNLQLTQPFNVIAYGADPTAGSDSCQAFRDAISAYTLSNYSNSRLAVPDGVYLSSCALAFRDEAVNIVGNSPYTTQIRFTNAADAGIRVSNAGVYSRVSIHGVTLSPTVAATQTAISIAFPATTAPSDKNVEIYDNIISSGALIGNNSSYFTNGIKCVSCTADVYGNSIYGLNEGSFPNHQISPGQNMFSAVELGGRSSNGFIHQNNIGFAGFAFYVHGDSEGNKIHDNNAVAVNWGLVHDDYAGSLDPVSAGYFPASDFHDNHVDAFFGGVWTKGWVQGLYSENLIYKRRESTSDWKCYSFDNGTYPTVGLIGTLQSEVHGGKCQGNDKSGQGGIGTGSDVAIAFGSLAQGNLVQGVHANTLTYFDDQSKYNVFNYNSPNIIENNVAWSTGAAGITAGWSEGASSYNIVRNNYPDAVGLEASGASLSPANNTIPNVGGFNYRTFGIYNTKATAITAFAGVYAGMDFYLTIDDSHTSFVHGSGLLMSRGISTGTLRNGQVFHFRCATTLQCREVSRTN